MKTKYLIAMLAAPIFFTGCSQDELISSVPGTETIEGTAYGDNLVFNVEDKNDASTRLTTSGAWSEGDRIGMAWISDQYLEGETTKPEVGTPINAFASATNIIGNTPLEFVSGSSFQSRTMMFVGTYLAYYPFNEEVKSVGPLKLSVGANQTSKDMADAYNKMIFASDTLSLQDKNAGTGKTPTISMKRLSNMLILDIFLKKASTTMANPVIQKVELDLRNGSNSLLAISGTVSPKDWTIANTKAEGNKKYFKDLGSATYMTSVAGDKGVITATTAEDLAVSETRAATVYMSFLPSNLTGLDASKSVLKVYTNYGVIEYSYDGTTDSTMPIYNWDATTGAYKKDPAKDVSADKVNIVGAFAGASNVAGRLIKKKVVIDLDKVSVDNLTATNATEIRNIVNNWKLKGGTPAPITINVTHPADYKPEYEESGKTCKNIELEALDLSDIPAALTINATDTLVFKGATNLATGKGITVQEDGSTAQSVIFNGNTTIGTLDVKGLIEFNENTTIKGTLTQVPATATDVIKVANGKTLTIDGGKLVSNTANYSKLINAGTISLINSGAIHGDNSGDQLAIENYAEKGKKNNLMTYYEGTINIGNSESQGYLAGVKSFMNGKDAVVNVNEAATGTVRFYNGDFDTPTGGTVKAVASNGLQFAAAVEKNVTTIEVTGEIKFSTITLNEIGNKATTVVMKSGSKLNTGTKAVTLGEVIVAENATIEGEETLVIFKSSTANGKLSIKPSATLTVAANTEINAHTLDLPASSKIEGDAKTSKVLYTKAGLVGGTYTAYVAQATLENVGND